MILATYIPYNKKKIEYPVKCFLAETEEELLYGSYFNQEKQPEVLVLFETEDYKVSGEFYEVNELPDTAVRLQIGEVVNGDAFLCDKDQREAFPEEQAKRRKKCTENIKGKMAGKDDYDAFLPVQQREFVKNLLPIWAPFLLSFIKGGERPVNFDAFLSSADESKIENNKDIKNKTFLMKQIYTTCHSHGLTANDLCFCGSGRKFKKCHGIYL